MSQEPVREFYLWFWHLVEKCGMVTVSGPQSELVEVKKVKIVSMTILSAEMQSKDGNYILLRDFNGHVGSSIDGYCKIQTAGSW